MKIFFLGFSSDTVEEIEHALSSMDDTVISSILDNLNRAKTILAHERCDALFTSYDPHGNPIEDVIDEVRQIQPNVPIILIPGEISPEEASELMRTGLNDIVLKSNLARLPGVLLRNIREARIHRENALARRLLEESQARYRTIWEHATTGYVLLSKGVIVDCNDAVAKLWGYPREELIGLDSETLTPPTETAAYRYRNAEECFTENKANPRLFKWEHLHRNGDLLLCEVTMSPIHIAGRKVVAAEIRDVTEKVRAEEALKRSETLLRTAGELGKIGGWELDLVNNKLFWTSVTRMIHEVGDDFVPTIESAIKFYSPEYRDLIQKGLESAILNGTGWIAEAELVTKNGNHRWVRMIGEPVMKAGNCVLIQGAFQDITSHKQDQSKRQELRKQVMQLQRIETIGTLAGGIAHDFNNLLSAIRGWSELAQRHTKDNEKAQADLEHVLAATNRARSLVDQILTFSRKSEINMSPTDPCEIVTEAVNMLKSTIPSTVEIAFSYSEDTPAIFADPGQLHQIVMNLGTNASQAMSGIHGNITIRLEEEQMEPSALKHNPLESIACAKLTISDDGPGIPASNLDRIFEPFFTTKAVHEGTGLGLSVVHGIVQSHHGTIRVDSTVGEGTTFTICLPCAEEENPQKVEEDSRSVLEGSEHILLLDDEKDIALSLAENLREFGYKISAFDESKKALMAYMTNPKEYDLILTDQIMPHMTGTEMVSKIRKLPSLVPVIILTGFSENVTQQHIEQLGRTKVLLKPCTTAEIVLTIRESIDTTANVL